MYEGPVQGLIDELGRLPGVGPKTAQRIAFHLLTVERSDLERLQAALGRVISGVHYCEMCFTVSDAVRCRICLDPSRDAARICVVHEAKDVQAIERTHEYRGRYHVLGGTLNPSGGTGPEDLRLRELLGRVGTETDGVLVREIILATSTTTEGEATAAYLQRLLRGFPDLEITKLASGLPAGADLEYTDEATLSKAIVGRRVIGV